MNTYQLTFFSLFIVIAYFVVTDESVAEYVNLIFAGCWVQLRKYYHMAILHPRNPITNFVSTLRYKRMAEDMCKKMDIPNDPSRPLYKNRLEKALAYLISPPN